MKTLWTFVVVAIVVVSCRTSDNERNAQMIVEVNSLALSTDDTLVIARSVTNTDDDALWLNLTVHAFEMTNAQGQAACVDGTLDLTTPELVRLSPLTPYNDEKRYALADLQNCAPGLHSIVITATLRRTEEGPDSFTLRSQPSGFEITAPTP